MATPIPAIVRVHARRSCRGYGRRWSAPLRRAGRGTVRGVSIDSRSIGRARCSSQSVARVRRPRLPAASRRAAPQPRSCDRPRHRASRCVEVADTLTALGSLARRHLVRTRAARASAGNRDRWSSRQDHHQGADRGGDRALFGSTLSTPGNLNNLIGVPMTIFTLDRRPIARRCSNAAPTARRDSAPGADRPARRRTGAQRRSRA